MRCRAGLGWRAIRSEGEVDADASLPTARAVADFRAHSPSAEFRHEIVDPRDAFTRARSGLS